MQYYVKHKGRPYGPVDTRALRTMLELKKFDETTIVSTDRVNWVPISQMKETVANSTTIYNIDAEIPPQLQHLPGNNSPKHESKEFSRKTKTAFILILLLLMLGITVFGVYYGVKYGTQFVMRRDTPESKEEEYQRQEEERQNIPGQEKVPLDQRKQPEPEK